ncbi:MAG: hypothetical protein RL282_613 [Bacteroidota bacterium]
MLLCIGSPAGLAFVINKVDLQISLALVLNEIDFLVGLALIFNKEPLAVIVSGLAFILDFVNL